MKTQKKAQHTPTPWFYDGEFISPCSKANDRWSVTGEPILEVKDSPNWEANAAFIVRAVNSHEALSEFVDNVAFVLRCMTVHDAKEHLEMIQKAFEVVSKKTDRYAQAEGRS